jgi:hypothetical protein
MRKLLITLTAIVSVVGLLVLHSAAPADAFVAQMYQHYTVQNGTCILDITWGQYGAEGYAVMTEKPGSNCHSSTGISAYTTEGNYWCFNWMRLGGNTAHCDFNGYTTMSHMVGTGYGGQVRVCWKAVSVECVTWGFGPWG